MMRRHPYMPIILCAYMCITTMAILNVVTGIFVENAVAAAKEDEENQLRETMMMQENLVQELHRFFHSADGDGNGLLTLAEFNAHVEQPTVKHRLVRLDIDVDEAKGLFRLMD